MKKVKILGKMIPVFVLVLLGVGLVSGALVGFLSNTITAKVTVESPLVHWISKSDGSGWTEAISFGSIHGGENVTLYTMDKNLADVQIKGNVESIVTGTNISCDDFASVVVDTRIPGGDYVGGGWDLINMSLCTDAAADEVVFGFPGNPQTFKVDQVDINKIVVTFKTNAVGNYTFTNRIVPIE